MSKNIYLTFDDGPNEPYTSQVLDILKEHGAKATFFFCGKNILRFPGVTRRVVEEGHAIGNHTYSHNPWRVITGMLRTEIRKTNDLIEQETGLRTKLYRSPWGITMPWLARWLRKNGFSIWHWDLHAYDWRRPSPEYIAQRIISRAHPGAVVLLHVGLDVSGGDRSEMVQALPSILRELGKEGYVFTSLPA